MSHAPKGPDEAPDLGALSALAPQLAQTFVSIASDIALVIDQSGVIRNVALGADPITGSAGDWVGRPWSDTVTGDTRRKIELLLSEAQAGGVTPRREVSHRTSAGDEIPVAYAAVRLGRDGPVLAVGRDLRAVSAIQQRFLDAQQSMERDYWRQRQHEARYRMLFQVATDGVLVVDAGSLQVIEANRSAAQLFQSSVEDLVGRPLALAMAPPARAAVAELLATSRTSGRPGEIRVAAAGSAERPLAVDISATPFRADDSLLLLVRARSAASTVDAGADSRRLAEFVERMPDAVVITDSSGRVLMANPAFADLASDTAQGRVAALGNPLGQALADLLGDPQGRLRSMLGEARRVGIAEGRLAAASPAGRPLLELGVSAALLAEGDQECLGLTLRRIEPRLQALPPQVGALATAIDRLAAQVGISTLPELLQETADLAERHLIEAALARTEGDRLQAAQLLGITPESFWLRLRHHRLDRGPDGGPSRLN